MRGAKGRTIGVSIGGSLIFELQLLRELAASRGHVEVLIFHALVSHHNFSFPLDESALCHIDFRKFPVIVHGSRNCYRLRHPHSLTQKPQCAIDSAAIAS